MNGTVLRKWALELLPSSHQVLISRAWILSSSQRLARLTICMEKPALAAIARKLKARFSYAVEYDSNPAPGAVQTDTLSRVTLIYDF